MQGIEVEEVVLESRHARIHIIQSLSTIFNLNFLCVFSYAVCVVEYSLRLIKW